MTPTLRLAALVLVLAAVGCESRNAGKIVGRWRADSVDLPVGPNGPADIVWEFTEDGKFTILRVIPDRAEPNTEKVAAGRYTLGLRDSVTLTNLDPPLDGQTKLSEQVVIDGDKMIVGGRGKDSTFRFTRLPPK
ncbi:hypothetical protein [Urbifossiella limnaea]|uniref:Lipocalin-like domain-containing protein n=1 Tax=Urbifossiella limnaea TaxID=2528023 RepID=A0A517XSL5_9BACT|nr:hypothetical protein [Urbifossiella limnaea]QDU20497.1 hypothetical protein ETAA1_24490 [Urbifossiella limnaea]